ncbi:unnamed protein product [Fraxinus pennsylvanica]|uniref:Uncharacterized protein n=1 Tax=Fraxinus pennsylvanica TaxID=56036 RepID=A0AAD2A4D7_9LAMI|nr:unnamed protein product [Fraxinus pennsylvanica]
MLYLQTRMIKVVGFIIFGFWIKRLNWNPSYFLRGLLMALVYILHSLKDCPVKVFEAQFPGIVLSSGFSCSQSSHIEFSLCVPSHDQEHAEGQTIPRFSWKDKKIYSGAIQSQDASLLHSLHQLKITEEGKSKAASDWSMKTIANEIIHSRELLSSTNCKIGKLTLARLLMAQNKLISYGIPNDGIELSPIKTGDFEYGIYSEILQLHQVYLSHNKIRSIEGLKVLQLLSCLNLSNNKICSFVALDPLRMLKSLKVEFWFIWGSFSSIL